MSSKEKAEKLLATSAKKSLSNGDLDAQRRSFVYGNTKLENEYVTKTMVDELADRPPSYEPA